MTAIPDTNLFRGRCLSPGLADGTVVVLDSDVEQAPCIDAAITRGQVDTEHGLLDDAVDKVTCDLLQVAAKVEREISSSLGKVFDAHRLIVNDESLRTEIRLEITENMVGAGTAISIVLGRWEKRFLDLQSKIGNSAGEDMADVSRRLRDALNEVLHPAMTRIPPGCVLIRSRLLPSHIILMADHPPGAIVVDHGSYGSHAALFAREMALPCIAGCHGLRARIGSLQSIRALVDAEFGTVTLEPGTLDIERFEHKERTYDRDRRRAIDKAQAPAKTIDGTTVAVMANVGTAKEALRAIENGADGIGLLRIEHVYLARSSPPDVSELIAALRPILEPFAGKPMCIRLLDAGSDKPLPFLGVTSETNPALGLRGIRLLRAHPHLLDTGLRALIELSKEFPLSILIPMVTVLEDITAVRSAVSRICAEMLCLPPPIGAMIETPAAALMIDQLRNHLEFISFGTNDLTQYCFAVDRDTATAEDYFQDGHEAILRLLHATLRKAPGLPASLCGELAARHGQTDKLLGIGLRTLSVAAPAIAEIKEAVRAIDLRTTIPASQRSGVACDPQERHPIDIRSSPQHPRSTTALG